MPPRQLFSPFLRIHQSHSTVCSRLVNPFPKRLASQRRPYGSRGAPRYNRFSDVQRLWYTNPAFRYGIGAVGAGGGLFYYWNLEKVPITGRLRFNCIPSETEQHMGNQEFNMILQQYRGRILHPSHPYSRIVTKVLGRLIPASGLGDLNWEVRVIDDPAQMNAFVLPGGKVFVFSGILPICRGEDGLAAVLGHEIAHQLAHHTGEKISQMFYLLPLAALIALSIDVSGQLIQTVLDLILSRPGSRKMESEADYIGLLMMSQACYDPNAAVGLWQRMAKNEQDAPPQFLSTHPTSKNRITTIEQRLPQAQEKRAESQCGSTIGFADDFKRAFRSSDGDFFGAMD